MTIIIKPKIVGHARLYFFVLLLLTGKRIKMTDKGFDTYKLKFKPYYPGDIKKKNAFTNQAKT